MQEEEPSGPLRTELERAFARGLGELEDALEARRKTRYLHFVGPPGFPGISPVLLRRAEALARRVWASGGTGASSTAHRLVEAISAGGDPASLPFLRECLERHVPREKEGPKRRALALRGIALLAGRGSGEAAEELRRQLAAADARTRAAAVQMSLEVFGEDMPDWLFVVLRAIAATDDAFAPRFLARAALIACGERPPIDVPDGAYVLKVILRRRTGVSRTIEVGARQSLHDLARAVLAAFRWDDDHLYAFYFDEANPRGPLSIGLEADFEWPAETDDGPSDVVGEEEVVGGGLASPLGALGLARRQRFVLHYDFGDDHLFDLTVESIAERVRADVQLPRVVAREGKSPPQYLTSGSGIEAEQPGRVRAGHEVDVRVADALGAEELDEGG
jgi:hypothetical protein